LKSLCAGDREFLMSGISPLGWEKKYGDPDMAWGSCGHFNTK